MCFVKNIKWQHIVRWQHDRKFLLMKKRLQNLLKYVFKEEFKRQEVNIMNIISSNFTLTMKEIKSLKQEVNDLKESTEFTQNDLEEKVPNQPRLCQ